jgi:WD40 repeat protein
MLRFRSTHSGNIRRRQVASIYVRLAAGLLVLANAPVPSVHAQGAQVEVTGETFFNEVSLAQTDLDAGRIGDAKKRLAATDASRRSFEYEYLQLRAGRATAEGTAAPDLIQRLVRPSVETRYGVLNTTNRQVVFICRDGGLRVHDLKTPDAPSKELKHPKDAAIWSGAFSLDGKSFFAGHQNGDVVVWDATKWETRTTVPLGEWPVRELAAAPDGSAFVAETQKELELWSLVGKQPEKVASVGERYNFGEGLAFSPKGDLIASGGMFDILLHDAKTGKPTRSMRHASYTMGLEFSPDGKRIASAPRGNVNKFLAVYDITQDAPLFNAGPFGNYVAGIAFTPDGKRIAATGCEKLFRLFDASTGKVAITFNRPECGS